MRGGFLHMLWFIAAGSIVAFAALTFAGKLAYSSASGEFEPALVRDVSGHGVHQLYGIILVSNTCDQLSGRLLQVSTSTYEVSFSTWREPSTPCSEERTPRAFHEALFAPPQGVSFVATLNGLPFPIAIITATSSKP
jgi:hypothetical protein